MYTVWSFLVTVQIIIFNVANMGSSENLNLHNAPHPTRSSPLHLRWNIEIGTTMANKRIKVFHRDLVEIIPRIPNNKESLDALQEKQLTDLLVIYINWKIRFVDKRPRKVNVDNSANQDKRWQQMNKEINVFLEKVENGDDLTPHLSLRALKVGYSLKGDSVTNPDDSWDDKDFILNVMGYHHFHLGEKKPNTPHADRTNEVLFAKVSRDTFTILAILDHSVFEESDPISGKMEQDRQMLWSIFDQNSKKTGCHGGFIIPSMIMTSGHSYNTVKSAIEYVRVINEINPKLDDPNYVNNIPGFDNSKTKHLRWYINHLDLGILDKSLNIFGVLKYWPN